MLIINDMQEFINNFDPYDTDRKKIYANCRVDTDNKPQNVGVIKTCANRDCQKQFRALDPKRKYCCTACKERESSNRKRERFYAAKNDSGMR